MARRGRYKYNYIHDYEPQLFDLDSDPGEWRNLAADAAHKVTADELQKLILDRFDPETIAAENLASLYRRRLIGTVRRGQGHSWKHRPTFDPRRDSLDQYLP